MPPNSRPVQHQYDPRVSQSAQLPQGTNKSASNGRIQHRPNSSITSNPSQISTLSAQESFANGNATYFAPNQATPSALYDSAFSPVNSADIFEVETGVNRFTIDDYLTPDYSSENPYSENNTPQEAIWEREFLSTATHTNTDEQNQSQVSSTDAHSQDLYGPSKNNPPQPNSRTQAQLLSPSLSTTPSPPASQPQVISPQALDSRNMLKPSSVSGVLGKRRSSASLQLDTNTTSAATHAQSSLSPANPQNLSAHAISPIVTITSHSRGDSPARSNTSVSRSNSKRGRARDDDDGALNTGRAASSSRLAIPSYFDTESFDDDEDTGGRRQGVAPQSRSAEETKSSKALEEERELEETKNRVEGWLNMSETGKIKKVTSLRPQQQRVRAYSVGSRSPYDQGPVRANNVPGPGLLLREDSADELIDDSDGSMQYTPPPETPKREDSEEEPQEYFPTADEQEQEPLPRQFLRPRVWQDPVTAGDYPNTKDQPETSNAAMSKYEQMAKEWDGRSRVATWGTGHRMSDLDLTPVVDNSKATRHLSLSKRGRGERRSSLINKAKGLIPRRSNSNLVRKQSEDQELPNIEERQGEREAAASSPLHRLSSASKPKSPAMDTGSAFAAMTGHLTAVGGGSGFPAPVEKDTPRSPLHKLKIGRSKSDAGRKDKDSKYRAGLADMMRSSGGPPVVPLASPMHNRDEVAGNVQQTSDDEGNEDDDDGLDDGGFTMDLSLRLTNIIPTIDGFRNNCQELNPRIPGFLLDRIAQDQVRRYKKLVEAKIKHTRAVVLHKKCGSGKHCFALHGEAALVQASPKPGDPDASRAQFQITNVNDAKIDEVNLPEGAVTPAGFPAGIPLPPVDRLPAEFECPWCFKVKKFQKPSDWTKHIHEDVQPFSCTYENCQEPKSFKRKADWVRHENERHRHLEWWKCNVSDCNHVCYRKDNFVQHLVREHKKTEPKTKGRVSGSNKRPGSSWQDPDAGEVWKLVDECRWETPRRPKDEPCRFCGNILTSWKKLSVHMAKHMEQLSMQVLDLVKAREVSPDTIISPIEQPAQHPLTQPMSIPATAPDQSIQATLSPYGATTTPVYHNSSAGQSPVVMQKQQSTMANPYEQMFYSPQSMHRGTTGSQTPEDMYNGNMMHSISSSVGYHTTQSMSSPQQYLSTNQTFGGMYVSAGGGYNQAANLVGMQQHPQMLGSHQNFDASFDSLNLGDMPATAQGMHDMTGQNVYSGPLDQHAYMQQYGTFNMSGAGHGVGDHNQHPSHPQNTGRQNMQPSQGAYFFGPNQGHGHGHGRGHSQGGYDQYQ